MYMVKPCSKCVHIKRQQYALSHVWKSECIMCQDMDERIYCRYYKRRNK